MKLGDRMKKYEKVFDHRLMIKTPVILWVDGKAFHTFTRGLDKPFDYALNMAMRQTAKHMCESIQGAKMAYTQSDEIGILITDWENFETSPWFDYRVQKMASIGASMATRFFNEEWPLQLGDLKRDDAEEFIKHVTKKAMFDCRVFNLPDHEVENWFIFRQLDWIRNSVQMVARSEFSQKQLHRKNQAQMKEMLREKDVIWDDLNKFLKYGTTVHNIDGTWVYEPIVFKKNREFIRDRLLPLR